MAQEHVLVMELEPAINFICSNTSTIEKGTLLSLADPMTAAAHAGGSAAIKVAGVCAKEKIANDGVTEVAVYRRGIFRAVASGTVTVGDPLVSDTYANHLKSAIALTAFDVSGARIVGHALETASTGESFLYELNIISHVGVN